MKFGKKSDIFQVYSILFSFLFFPLPEKQLKQQKISMGKSSVLPLEMWRVNAITASFAEVHLEPHTNKRQRKLLLKELGCPPKTLI